MGRRIDRRSAVLGALVMLIACAKLPANINPLQLVRF